MSSRRATGVAESDQRWRANSPPAKAGGLMTDLPPESATSQQGRSDPPATSGPGLSSSQALSPPRQSGDLVQSVTTVERGIKRRRETDKTFINYWLYFFIVSW